MPHDFDKFPELTNSQLNLYYFESPHKQIVESFRGTVVNVHDGDTIRIKTDFREFDFPIRMANIAAPELKEGGGINSRNWLANEILGKDVDVIINPKNRVGKWGRLIGEILFGGININEESVRTGHSVNWEDRHQGIFVSFERIMESVAI